MVPSRCVPTLGPACRYLWDLPDELWGQMEVSRRSPLLIDVVEDALDVLRIQADGTGDRFRRQAVIPRVETEVHLGHGEREVELLLGLRERIGVRGRRACPDGLGDAEMFRQ